MSSQTFAKQVKPLLLGTAVWVTFLSGTILAKDAEIVVRASTIHSAPYPARDAVDGNSETRWASTSASNLPEWFQIDFGRRVTFKTVVIRWERAFATDYALQVSDDARTWLAIHEQTDGKGGEETIRNLKGAGRYFRVLCRKPNHFGLYSIWEIQFPDGGAAEVFARHRRIVDAQRQNESELKSRLLKTLADRGVEDIIFALRQPGKDGHWYANFSYYADSEDRLTYGNGGKLCRLNLASGKVTALLVDPVGAVRDPVLSYDARKILFSYREGESKNYHLYEMPIDGGTPHQLTDGPFDDIEPNYLPDGRIVFVSSRCKRWVNCWLTKVAVLHRCNADGSGIRPISANLEHENTPWPLPDGRILYQRWEYVDRSQVDYHHLWTTNPDGTGQMVYYGNMHPSTLMIDAKPIPETKKVVAIFSPGHGRREHDGVITVVDPSAGPDDMAHTRSVTREAAYRDPWAFSEDVFLAVKGKQILLLDRDGNACEVYRVTREEEAAGFQCHEPRPIMPRQHERIIPDRFDSSQGTGTLLLADIYNGRNMQGIQRGDIKKLLVLESLPKPINYTGGMDPLTYGGSFTLERVLGVVPVEEDGSAYVELPALRAVFFVALDQNGMAIKRMQSFLTVQPGEQTSCVGCHEQRTHTLLPSSSLLAQTRPPSQIQPIADCPDVFDFPRDIQPILDELCVDCHGYEKTDRGGPYAGNIILTGDRGPMFSHAYFTMTVRQIFTDNRNRPQSNYGAYVLGSGASRIFDLIDGTHYGVKATPHQINMLRLWIDVGAPYPGTYAALGSGAIGGYAQNQQINTDADWPTTRAGAEVIGRRCAVCHQKNDKLPRSISDELGISFWRFELTDPRLRFSRHIMFNLSRPEKSLLLLAPLATASGGFGLCRDADGKPADVFSDTEDPDYEELLAMVAAGKKNLDTIKRFDMAGFRPPQPYLREMRHYGILPEDHPDDAPVDFYELDRLYWQSLWPKMTPPIAGR